MAKTNEQKYAEANGCIELDAPGATRRIAVSFELFVAYNEDINRVRNANARDQDHGTVSADAPFTGSSSATPANYWDVIGDDLFSIAELRADAERKVLTEKLFCCVDMVLDELAADELSLIRALFFDQETLRQRSEVLGVSHTAVRKRRDKGLGKLKTRLLDSLDALDDETLEALGELYDLGRDSNE